MVEGIGSLLSVSERTAFSPHDFTPAGPPAPRLDEQKVIYANGPSVRKNLPFVQAFLWHHDGRWFAAPWPLFSTACGAWSAPERRLCRPMRRCWSGSSGIG